MTTLIPWRKAYVRFHKEQDLGGQRAGQLYFRGEAHADAGWVRLHFDDAPTEVSLPASVVAIIEWE